MNDFSFYSGCTQKYSGKILTIGLMIVGQFGYAEAQEVPYNFQNQGYTVFTPGQVVTPGGGYARQATQAGQATQARQAEGYVSPFSPSQPYRPTLPTANIIESPIPTYNVQTYNSPPSIIRVAPTETSPVISMPYQPNVLGRTGATITGAETRTGGNTVISVSPSQPSVTQNIKGPETSSISRATPTTSSVTTQSETAVPLAPSSVSSETTAENVEAGSDAKTGEGDTKITVEQPAAITDEGSNVSQAGGEVHQEKKKKVPGMTLEQIIAMRKASEERAKRNLVREDVGPISSIDTVREWSGPNLNNLITQVGEMVRSAGQASIAMIKQTTLAIVVNPDDIEDVAKKEDKELEAARKKLLEELEKKRKLKEKIKEAKRRMQEELDRKKNDKKYKARRDAEDKLEQERKELERKNKELKRKAKKHGKDGEDLEREDKNLREIEDEMRRDGDPNCRSSACQNVRRLRADNQADKNTHRETGKDLKEEAKQFNKDVKDHKKAAQLVEDMKDQKFGMNDAEFDKHKADKKIKKYTTQEDKINQAIEDLKNKAKRQGNTTGINDQDAADFRNQMKGLEGLLERNDQALIDAQGDSFVAEAVSLGLDATAAEKAFAQSRETFEKGVGVVSLGGGDPSIFDHIPKEFMKEMNDAKIIKDMDVDTLTNLAKQYGSAIEHFDATEKALKSGEIPKGGSPKTLAKFGQLADKIDVLEKERTGVAGYFHKLDAKTKDFKSFKKAYFKENPQNQDLPNDQLREKFDEAVNERNSVGERLSGLQEQAGEIRLEMRGLLPVVEIDIFSRQVGLLNTEIANGLPLGSDGKVDRKIFGNNVAAVADQQVQLAKLGSELDTVTRKLSVFKSQSGLTAQQAQHTEVLAFKRDQIKAKQSGVVKKLDALGVGGKMQEGKFVPTPMTRGGAITWNTARDQVVNTFKGIEENRQKVAEATNKKVSLADLPEEPEKSKKSTIQKVLDKDKKALEQIASRMGGISGAALTEFVNNKGKGASADELVTGSNQILKRLADPIEQKKSKEVLALEADIAGIDDNIEAVEATMIAARAHKITGLEVGLNIQRETLFSSRAALETRLDQETRKTQKQIVHVQTRTKTESKQTEQLKNALSSLDLNISAVTAVEEAMINNGNQSLSQGYKAQRQALAASRSQVAKALERQRTVEEEKAKTNPRGLNSIDRLLGRGESPVPAKSTTPVITVPKTALINEKTKELSKAIASLNKSIETVEETMLATEKSNVPGLTKTLDDQREAMFEGRDSLEKQLDAEREKLRAKANKPKEKSSVKATELAIDENIKSFDTAALHYRTIGQNNLAQIFEVQKAALEAEKNRLKATQASYTVGEGTQNKRSELEEVSELVLWINKDILPAFSKEDPVLGVLPGVLSDMTQRFGADIAEQLIDEALDELVDNGLKPDGAVLLDALFKRINRELTSGDNNEQNKVSEKPRLKFLAEILATRKKGTNDQETAYLKASYGQLKSKLEAQHHEKLKTPGASPLELLIAVSSLVDLASLPGTDPKELTPLISQLQRQLERVEKGMKQSKQGELMTALESVNLNTRRLLAQIQKTMPKGNEKTRITSELTKQLIKVNEMRAVVYGRKFSTKKSKTQEELRKKYAISRLEQVRNLVNTGSLAEAMSILKELETKDPSIEQSRSLALIDIITQIEQRYGFLNASEREKLGKLSDLRDLREGALKEFLKSTKDPKIFAGISLHWSERLLREGNFTEASDVLNRALIRKPNDPSLLALQVRVSLAKMGKEATPEIIKSLLGNIPVEIGPVVSGIVLNGFIERGQHANALALIEVLKSAEDIDEATKQRLSVQLEFAEISIMASGLGTTQDSSELKKKLGEFEKLILSTPGLDEKYKAALIASSKRLSIELSKAEAWEQAVGKAETSSDELGSIAKLAVSAGRYDIAGAALQKQLEKLLNESGPKEIGRGFIQAVRLLDGIRMRSLDPRLTKAHRETFAEFLKKNGAGISKKLEGYFKERINVAAKSARVKKQKSTHQRSRQQIQLELRSLAQLKIRLDLLSEDPKTRQRKMSELIDVATKEVDKKEAQILKAFDGLGTVLRDNENTKINLAEQLSRLSNLRSIRDGLKDYFIENAENYTPPNFQMWGMNYGSFLPKNHREWEITTIQRKVAGVYANGKSADKIWEERKHTRDFTVGRGLREKTLANHKNTPEDRDYKKNEKKYRNHWLTLAMDDAELKYLDQRRAELINEDRTRGRKERGTLYETLINAEAKYLRKLVGTSNAFLEMFEKMAQTGRLMKGAAQELEGRIVMNQQRLLIEEYQSALIDEDAQRLFRAMIPLREASLAGELNSFVSYLHIEWYNAGPARAANLLGGMKDTQAELEEVIAESQKLNIALIRAGYNLPEQLSKIDQEVLRTHGFLKNGVYVIPEQIVLDPTKVGSEFAAKTQTGVAGTIDRFINAKQAGELFATIAVPGGIAGKFGRWATAEVLAYGAVRSLGGKALAYGTGLALEAGAFTLLNRTAQVALDPALLMKDGYWSSETLLKEYAHNLLIIGALKGFGAGAEGLVKATSRVGLKRMARLLKESVIFGEAAMLTQLNAMLEGNQITQDDYLANLLTIVMLKGTGKALESNKKSPLQRLNEVRINKWLESIGKPPVEGTGPITKVSQLRDAQIRHIEYVDWLLFVDKPTKILMETYKGDWDAARKDYENGNLSPQDMRKLVNLRRQIVDNLANEIVQEIGGEVQAFGSENLTSDYDISFVGPKAALGVILFNARFAGRWKMASEIGGRETGLVLDTNAYTETIQSLIKAGKGDAIFQDAFAHLSARKALPKEAWDIHKKWILENTTESKRAEVLESLNLAEKYNAEYKKAIEAQKELLRNDKENPIKEVDLQITAENRLYESALKDILELREAFDNVKGSEKETLRQKLRNAQSKALYFAQEAYYTQAAIEHVVFTIQAAGRSITAESLLSDTAPKLKIDLTPEQGRQSYFEQIAHMLHEITHAGDPAKLASKGAKYFIRALDAAQIAGLRLGSLEKIIRETVELNDNRSDLTKVREILAKELIEVREKELNRKLNDAEREAIETEAGLRYLSDVQKAANILTAALYNQASGLREAKANEIKSSDKPIEVANDNVDPDIATKPATGKAKAAEVAIPAAPGSGGTGGGSIKVDVSRPDLTAKAQKEFNFTDPSGAEHFLPLGKFLGSGSTSYVYEQGGNAKRVVRVTVAESWDARVLDEFGRFALEKLVDTRFIRIVERFARFDVTKTGTRYFEVRRAQSIEINEKVKEGTAQQMIEKQGGQMSKGQSLALDQAVRELNRRGLAWLDVKPDNYSFEKLPGTDRWRIVVLDPGGIVAMRGNSARERYDNARGVQELINQPSVDQMDIWQKFKNSRELVLNDMRQLVRENHRANFNFEAMKMPGDGKIAFNPGGVIEMAEVQRLFGLTPKASNDNYMAHYGKPPKARSQQ